MQEIQLILNPGRGRVSLAQITAVVGDRVGALPTPTRRGYVFTGWYLSPDGDPTSPAARAVSSATVVEPALFGKGGEDVMLYAGWERVAGAAARAKKTALGRQKTAIVALAVAAALLAVAFGVVSVVVDIYTYEDVDGVVYTIRKSQGEYGLYRDGKLCDVNDDGLYLTAFGTQLELDAATGEYEIYAVVDTEGTEQVGVGQHILMFKQLTYDATSTKDQSTVINRIEIHNQHGSMTLLRGQNGDNRFTVEGAPSAMLVDELFAQLAVGVGYTISMQRLENPARLPDGSIDYAEYGLVPEERERTEEDGTKTAYEYTPTWYSITTMTGETYKVTLGDATVAGTGYYARYAERDTVYILASTNLEEAVLQPIEALITPYLIYPMSSVTYFQVSEFAYRTDIDHDGIYRDLVLALSGLDLHTVVPDAEGHYSPEVQAILSDVAARLDAMSEEDFEALYRPVFEANSRLVTAFSFVDVDERQDTLYASMAYRPTSKYMAGYLCNTDNINDMLYSLYGMSFREVTALAPTAEEMEACGLDAPLHDISFIYKDAQGQEYQNHLIISEKTAEGLYYGYADTFDMIVCFTEAQAPYLEWKPIDWYDREYFQSHIAYIQSLTLEGQGMTAPIRFDLDNSKSDQSEGVSADKLEVYANGQLMNYKLLVTKPSGTKTEETASYNFRRFVQALLSASMEGTVDLTEAEMAALRETPDGECLLKMTAILDDGKGNHKYAVYRFYRYTERKAYLTVELLDSPDEAGDPTRAQGSFYVLSSFCDKLIADAYRFMAGEEIVVESKN